MDMGQPAGLDVIPILDKLEKVKRSADGWVALCPAHDDHMQSLSISEGSNKILLHCFAGCQVESIAAAINVPMTDLFADKEPAIAPKPLIYVIRDTEGYIVAFHERVTRDGHKQFFWRRPNGELGLNGTKVADLPLYGSQHIRRWDTSRPIFIVEGEKATMALTNWGFRALGTVCGAAAIPSVKAFEPLRGHHVIVWADNDEPGREHMRNIVRLLKPIAATLAEFPRLDASQGADAADYVESHEPADLEALLP